MVDATEVLLCFSTDFLNLYQGMAFAELLLMRFQIILLRKLKSASSSTIVRSLSTRTESVFLGIITLLAALLCDLFLLPSLLAHFDKARSADVEGIH